jgi:hypothetical protein
MSHTDTPAPPPTRIRTRDRLVAVLLSVTAAAVVWGVASLLGVRFDVASPAVGSIHIGLFLTIVSTLPLASAGWGVLVLLERFTARPRRTWTILAGAVLVLSLPPLVFLDAQATTKIALGCMHLATGLVLIALLRRTAPRYRGQASI